MPMNSSLEEFQMLNDPKGKKMLGNVRMALEQYSDNLRKSSKVAEHL